MRDSAKQAMNIRNHPVFWGMALLFIFSTGYLLLTDNYQSPVEPLMQLSDHPESQNESFPLVASSNNEIDVSITENKVIESSSEYYQVLIDYPLVKRVSTGGVPGAKDSTEKFMEAGTTLREQVLTLDLLELYDRLGAVENEDDMLGFMLELWSYAPYIYAHPDFDQLLQLNTYSIDQRMQELVGKMRSDRDRFQGYKKTPVEIMATQMAEFANAASSSGSAHSTLKARQEIQQKEDILTSLEQLALYSDNSQERTDALLLIREHDQDGFLGISRQIISTSHDQSDRLTLLESVRSMIGDYDTPELLNFFETLALDYDPLIAGYSQQSVQMINSYSAASDERT